MTTVLHYPHPLLSTKLALVTEFGSELSELIYTMTDTMRANKGVGLAANQIGVNQSVVVWFDGFLINPIITRQSGSVVGQEGCLSFTNQYVPVERATNLTVIGRDQHNQPVSIEVDGILAIVLQHEIDHVNGLTFLDRISKLRRDLIKAKLR